MLMTFVIKSIIIQCISPRNMPVVVEKKRILRNISGSKKQALSATQGIVAGLSLRNFNQI